MTNRNIRDFFRPAPKPTTPTSNVITASLSSRVLSSAKSSPTSESIIGPARSNTATPATTTSSTATPVTVMSSTAISPSALSSTGTSATGSPSTVPKDVVEAIRSSSQFIVKASDDEDSESDSSSIDPLEELFQSHNSKAISTNSPRSPLKLSTNTASARGVRQTVKHPLSPARPEYKFDMKSLISHAEKDNATEASAARVRVLLNESAAKESISESRFSRSTNGDLLDVVAADADATDNILQALKRTEATIIDKRCYFFNTDESITVNAWPRLANKAPGGWQEDLNDSQARELIVLSGFARDMVSLGDTLPDELLLWMLDETCFENRSDLRQAYCHILSASHDQIFRLIQPLTISNIFRKLGATRNAVDVCQKVYFEPVRLTFKSRSWTNVRVVIKLLGQISPHLSSAAKFHGLSLLTRFGADRVMLENVGLLDAIQGSMEDFCQSIDSIHWEQCCLDVCASVYFSIQSTSNQYRVIRCIPRTTPRLHELRRRLSLACFFEDNSYSTRSSDVAIDLWEITKRLGEPQFKISRDTDYLKLGAQMSILDVMVDNGISAEYNIADPEDEKEFNKEIDALSAQVRNMASSINSAGAAYMSRIDAKEIMESFRYRLLHAVRTKPQPKQGIFDGGIDKSENIHKQSELMKKHFKAIKA